GIKLHPLGPLFTFALFTGVRLGEATGLRWEDVDFENKTARIQVQLQRIDSKLVHKGLKSPTARRTCPLTEQAVDALREAKISQIVGGYENGMNLVFLNPEGWPLDPKYIDKKLKEVLANACLPVMSFHKLRHTAATLMVAGGIPIAQVQKLLGHSQISLTANLYAHADLEAKRRAMDVYEQLFRKED
ncbi:MAG: site-specific integrase, partial [Armatimonadetes bacterium]|nr:site-specific integrase [Armatimonadota bacterium]